MREARLLVTARRRSAPRLDDALAGEEPSLAELVAVEGERLWICGGEPTLREDLPDLIGGLGARQAGLVTDGLALAEPDALRPLIDRGLRRLRIVLHAARPDAHDWLVGRKGAARRAVRALRCARALGIATAIEATVTRPTAPHLAELVLLASELGAEAVHLRRLEERGPAAQDLIALAPRLGPIGSEIEAAGRAASTRGVALTISGFPRCAIPASVPSVEPVWRVPATLAASRDALEVVGGPGCATCPGAPRCVGISAAYRARFGIERLEPPHALEVVRVRFGAPSRVACPGCGADDPAPEPTRKVRLRLVRAARTGARVLRVASAGSLAHPRAADLLRETTLLGFERVEICGEASALDELDDAALYGLRGIARLDAAFYGATPDRHDARVRAGAFEATLRALGRVETLAGVTVGSYAIVHDAAEIAAFAAAWKAGRLPGAPAFRFCPSGGTLFAPHGLDEAARAALRAVLPACVGDGAQEGGERGDAGQIGTALHDDLAPADPPSPSDRHGMFLPCACDERRCPGIPVGWQRKD